MFFYVFLTDTLSWPPLWEHVRRVLPDFFGCIICTHFTYGPSTNSYVEFYQWKNMSCHRNLVPLLILISHTRQVFFQKMMLIFSSCTILLLVFLHIKSVALYLSFIARLNDFQNVKCTILIKKKTPQIGTSHDIMSLQMLRINTSLKILQYSPRVQNYSCYFLISARHNDF